MCALHCSQQHCKHFNRGEGTCPFGNSCFYKHGTQSRASLMDSHFCVFQLFVAVEYSDGTKATVHPRVAVNDQGEGKFVGGNT